MIYHNVLIKLWLIKCGSCVWLQEPQVRPLTCRLYDASMIYHNFVCSTTKLRAVAAVAPSR